MFNREKRSKRKLYQQNLKVFKAKFEQTMIDSKMAEAQPTSKNILDLWSTAILMDEATTLSRLTRWLIILSIVLSVLTFVLAFSTIGNFLAWLSVDDELARLGVSRRWELDSKHFGPAQSCSKQTWDI